MDLKFGYHQLSVAAGDQVETTLQGVDHDGRDQLYHWKFLSFGLKNTPVEFERVMDKVFYDLHFYRCCIDNIIIFNNTPKEHVRHLRPVLKRLWQWGLRLHHGKCKIFHDGLVYLGHKLIPRGFGCNKLRCTLCRRSRYWSMCQDFMLSWAWQITTVNSSRTLA